MGINTFIKHIVGLLIAIRAKNVTRENQTHSYYMVFIQEIQTGSLRVTMNKL